MAETTPLKTVAEWVEAEEFPPLTPAQEDICQALSDDAVITMGVDCSQGSDDPDRPRIRRGQVFWAKPDGTMVALGDVKARATRKPVTTTVQTQMEGTVTMKLVQASKFYLPPRVLHPFDGQNRQARRAAAAKERRS